MARRRRADSRVHVAISAAAPLLSWLSRMAAPGRTTPRRLAVAGPLHMQRSRWEHAHHAEGTDATIARPARRAAAGAAAACTRRATFGADERRRSRLARPARQAMNDTQAWLVVIELGILAAVTLLRFLGISR